MVEQDNYDLIVIGGGPGGYPAAIKAAQLGKSVALVEGDKLGGTCLNRGCIPSKTLIANAEVLKRVQEANEFGVLVGDISFDYGKMVDRKDRIVENIRSSLEGLIKANKISLFRGMGRFTSPFTIKVIGKDNKLLRGKKVIIATGSEPRQMAAFPCDGKKIHNSTTLLNIQTLPKAIAIIGGGIIGSEFASLYSALGVKVYLIELMATILPMESKNVSAALTKAFQKKGIILRTNALVDSVDIKGEGVTLKLNDGETINADIALVSVGRTLNTDKVGLEKAGVLLSDNGLIDVKDTMETNVPGIYAVGDIASKWWLAHVASHQGIVAGSNAAGVEAHMNYNAVPSAIFTDPEIGTVGLSLEEAITQGYRATLSPFPFQALGKAQATRHTEGFAQMVSDRETGQILGAQVVGHDAANLVAEMAIAINNELTVESIAETMHAHPTAAEAWLESALLANDAPLHLPPKAKKERAVQ